MISVALVQEQPAVGEEEDAVQSSAVQSTQAAAAAAYKEDDDDDDDEDARTAAMMQAYGDGLSTGYVGQHSNTVIMSPSDRPH